jgi:glutamyl-Q tRNA(Asp) synthetase
MVQSMRTGAVYRGRFAPSPTGPLHFGSLVAALGSYLEAKTRQGHWLLRIEDVDALRNAPGASDIIRRTLETYGFEWEGDPVLQSQRGDLYESALEQLRREGWLYPCGCTRREIADSMPAAVAMPGTPRRYPGTCRAGVRSGRTARSLRVRVEPGEIAFEDAVQGRVGQDVDREVGDFVLRRADGLIAYQLAVVADDAQQGVTHVVRGADLIDSTPRQIYLQRLLGVPTPAYLHLPVAANAAGEKLSKQTRAVALDERTPQTAVVAALAFLGQEPPAGLASHALAEVWAWAYSHWDLRKLPRTRARRAPVHYCRSEEP